MGQITIKFCTCPDSSAVRTCAKFYGDVIILFEVTEKTHFREMKRNSYIMAGSVKQDMWAWWWQGIEMITRWQRLSLDRSRINIAMPQGWQCSGKWILVTHRWQTFRVDDKSGLPWKTSIGFPWFQLRFHQNHKWYIYQWSTCCLSSLFDDR